MEFILNDAETTTLMPPETTLAMQSAAEVLSSEEHHHNQITFEIPSHHDLEHIDTLHNFNRLLQRIGNVAYDTVAATAQQQRQHQYQHQYQHQAAAGSQLPIDAAGNHITSEQIAKSVVLDLADLKQSSGSGLERFFDGADMHSIINYLWIGVVTSLVILSVIFILFSCYFYRKFRVWKKCNKDIRAHLSGEMYAGGPAGPCVVRPPQPADAAYYQVESPPCYTIATGLPTYDEALHQHQHFSYGMKFIYPTIAAVHHHPAISGNGAVITNWEKDDLTLRLKATANTNTQQQQQQQQQQQEQEQRQQKQKLLRASSVDEGRCPPSYDAAASVALLAADSTEKADSVSICMDEAAAGAFVA